MYDKPKPQITVRRIGQRSDNPETSAKRRAGQRMGLTTDQILTAAKICLAARKEPLTVKDVARHLGVAHNSISSRLRRDATTLERELTKQFLARISRPMRPQEDWQPYLQALFTGALGECEAHPGLARIVVPWIAQDPTLCARFSEHIMHALASAGLAADASADCYDVVLALLCGMLAVRFPDFAGHPGRWAKTVTQNLTAIDPHEQPVLSPGIKSLVARTREKASPKPASSRAFATQLASMVVNSVTEGALGSSKKDRRPRG